MTEKNRLCSKDGREYVNDLVACKEAVSGLKTEYPTAVFKNKNAWSQFPPGCFLLLHSKSVFFNTNNKGLKNANARHLCF